MKYTYATLLLEETGAEINERNLTAVLEAAAAEFSSSRVKALVAALEDIDIGECAAAAPEDDGVAAEDAEVTTAIDESEFAFDTDADSDPSTTAAAEEVSAINVAQSSRDEPTEGR